MSQILAEIFYWLVTEAGGAFFGLSRRVGLAPRPSPDGIDDGLERAARELGIDFERRFPRSHTAVGTVVGASVSVAIKTATDEDDQNPRTYLFVAVDAERIPRGLRFGEESGKGEDVLTGDPVFDDLVEVHGEPSLVLALFDKELRQKVAVCVRGGGSLADGRLTYRSLLGLPQADIPATLRDALDLATRLSSSEGGGLCARLARNAVTDPLPAVRLLNLYQLQERFPSASETREASRADLPDPSPWVRLAAARFLGDEALDVLEALAKDREVPDQAAMEAVALLAARLPADRAGALLLDVVKSRTGDAQRQAVEELGRLRHPPAFGPLVVVMDRGDTRTAAAAATALGALGDSRAEASLLGVLARGDSDVRLAAAQALGALGSVQAVAPLLALLESRGLDTAARQTVRGAIGAIQSRLIGAGAGQLSVADAAGKTGRLSLAGAEAGALSLASDIETAGPLLDKGAL